MKPNWIPCVFCAQTLILIWKTLYLLSEEEVLEKYPKLFNCYFFSCVCLSSSLQTQNIIIASWLLNEHRMCVCVCVQINVEKTWNHCGHHSLLSLELFFRMEWSNNKKMMYDEMKQQRNYLFLARWTLRFTIVTLFFKWTTFGKQWEERTLR